MTSWERHRASLHLTRQWCANHANVADPAGCLRSAAWRPPEYPDGWMCTALPLVWPEEVIERRDALAQSLAEQGLTPVPLPEGRILCFLDTDTGMTEGVPASAGFIDDAYLPPWDTWFACIRGVSPDTLLLAWIPSEFGELVQGAIDVSASESIRWLDEAVVLKPVAWPHLPSVSEWAAVRATLQEARAALT